MKLTSSYNLKKPDGSDVVNVQDLNDNSDKIDLELKKVEASLKEIANKVDNIKIADGTTSQKGIVQLNNTTNSISQTEAATANIVRLVNYAAQEADEKAREAHVKARNAQETADAAQKKAEEAFQSGVDAKNSIINAIKNNGGDTRDGSVTNIINEINNISLKLNKMIMINCSSVGIGDNLEVGNYQKTFNIPEIGIISGTLTNYDYEGSRRVYRVSEFSFKFPHKIKMMMKYDGNNNSCRLYLLNNSFKMSYSSLRFDDFKNDNNRNILESNLVLSSSYEWDNSGKGHWRGVSDNTMYYVFY